MSGCCAAALSLALGPVETEVSPTLTAAGHPILRGLLVRRSGGRISFEQVEGDPVLLRSRISGFHPRRGPFARARAVEPAPRGEPALLPASDRR